ncbi:ABC transporter ATP-binding protein [Microtetraspora sp. NBRC 16547]|uniref:ABC transporter ATP-binding protein n=1 Tax=Microtetraspora sp. NBRC 16547 TaxID=3030993 RepID=UPI0024A00AEB|nr:ABC transporter ATP-binding protein [Microtetraspora sp. NBRC 16547]GLX01228.1 Fe(3+) ions import ATP-binding protein FbpC [Microtetraspora sp. NBRC 16547]
MTASTITGLTITGVTKSFGATPVLMGIDLRIRPRTLTAVLGPSGCGKTTLLRLIAGFADPDAGTIAFGEETVFADGRSVPPQRRRVGYVPQEGALFPHLTVAANITFGLPRRARKTGARVAELLDLVGLEQRLATRFPHELSGGQQQRVALARALAPEPSVVLLDEPFSSLDAGLREGTRRAVAQALRRTQATAVLVTHDQSEALSLADQVAVMRQGRLVQLDSPATVYGYPCDAGVAEFVGEAVLLSAVLRDGRAECALGSLAVREPAGNVGRDDIGDDIGDNVGDNIGDSGRHDGGAPANGPAQVLIRPEQIRLDHASDAAGVAARVAEVSYFGHDAAVRLDLLSGVPGGPQVTARVSGGDLPATGALVTLTVTGDVLAYPAVADSRPRPA